MVSLKGCEDIVARVELESKQLSNAEKLNIINASDLVAVTKVEAKDIIGTPMGEYIVGIMYQNKLLRDSFNGLASLVKLTDAISDNKLDSALSVVSAKLTKTMEATDSISEQLESIKEANLPKAKKRKQSAKAKVKNDNDLFGTTDELLEEKKPKIDSEMSELEELEKAESLSTDLMGEAKEVVEIVAEKTAPTLTELEKPIIEEDEPSVDDLLQASSVDISDEDNKMPPPVDFNTLVKGNKGGFQNIGSNLEEVAPND